MKLLKALKNIWIILETLDVFYCEKSKSTRVSYNSNGILKKTGPQYSMNTSVWYNAYIITSSRFKNNFARTS
jgi:hypothetical protein